MDKLELCNFCKRLRLKSCYQQLEWCLKNCLQRFVFHFLFLTFFETVRVFLSVLQQAGKRLLSTSRSLLRLVLNHESLKIHENLIRSFISSWNVICFSDVYAFDVRMEELRKLRNPAEKLSKISLIVSVIHIEYFSAKGKLLFCNLYFHSWVSKAVPLEFYQNSGFSENSICQKFKKFWNLALRKRCKRF